MRFGLHLFESARRDHHRRGNGDDRDDLHGKLFGYARGRSGVRAQITQNGGTTRFGLGHGIPSATNFTITAAVSVAASTVNVDYNVIP